MKLLDRLELRSRAIWHGSIETFSATHQVLLVEAVQGLLSQIILLKSDLLRAVRTVLCSGWLDDLGYVVFAS